MNGTPLKDIDENKDKRRKFQLVVVVILVAITILCIIDIFLGVRVCMDRQIMEKETAFDEIRTSNLYYLVMFVHVLIVLTIILHVIINKLDIQNKGLFFLIMILTTFTLSVAMVASAKHLSYKSLREKLIKTIPQYNNRTNVQITWDDIQSQYECCGAEQLADWYFKDSFLPESCCINYKCRDDACNEENAHKVSCFTVLREKFSRAYSDLFFTHLASWSLGFLLMIVLKCYKEDEPTAYSKTSRSTRG